VPVVPIDHLNDERLLVYRGVRDPALARRSGLFVAEGRLVVERLLRMRRYSVESLLVSPTSLAALEDAVGILEPDVPVFVASPDELERLTGFNLHRGCLALVRRPRDVEPAPLIASAKLVVLLDGVADPDNVGGIFRNAAAFGADAVLLSRTSSDPLYRKAIRTSMAATLMVPFARYDDWPSISNLLGQYGFLLVTLSPRATLSIDDFVRALTGHERIALVLGTEAAGLGDDVRRAADADVRIPTSAHVDSLNVAVASGVALSRVSRV
jgi:tRNA G18 (ribose-2'-O)-methylase SpoU